MKKLSLPFLFVILAVIFVAVTVSLVLKKPTPIDVPSCYQDSICDPQGMLNEQERGQLAQMQSIMLNSYNIDMRILVSNKNPAETVHYFKASRVGEKSPSGMGILIMAETKNRTIRFQATAGMDSIFPVGFVTLLERDQSNQYMNSNQLALGLLTSAEAAVRRAKQAKENITFTPTGIPTGAIDNNFTDGVEPENNVGKISNVEGRPSSEIISLNADTTNKVTGKGAPSAVYREYLRYLQLGNQNSDLNIYTFNTQAMLKSAPRPLTDIDAERQVYPKCKIYKENIIKEGLAAVILFDIKQRQCAPHFLVFENGQWRLDLVARANHIVLDSNGQWYLHMNKPFFYADGLLDWDFTPQGAPRIRPPLRWGLLVQTDEASKVTFVKKLFDDKSSAFLPLQERDVILKWGNIEKPTADQVMKSLENTNEGTVIPVIFWRNGQTYTVDITAPPRLN